MTIMGRFPCPPLDSSCCCFSNSANAEPPTVTTSDMKSFLQRFNHNNQLQALIDFIKKLLRLEEINEIGSSSEASSYIEDGEIILKMLEERIGKLPEKKDSMGSVSAEAQKVVIDLLQGSVKIQWVGAALSVVGFVLKRFSQMSENKDECFGILERMLSLGEHTLGLNEQIDDQKNKIKEAIECIVVGCTMCASQLASSKLFRFLTASVDAGSLKDFNTKIDRLYRDLQLWGIIETHKRLAKPASQSQGLFGSQLTVGIDRGLKTAIRLLDLNGQHTSDPLLVIVHGAGGIGKTAIADAVYRGIDLSAYMPYRIKMEESCRERDLKELQEQILRGLYKKHLQFNNCDDGQGWLRKFFEENCDTPLFLYIDNCHKGTYLKRLLPKDLRDCLPRRSRILVTTRDLSEMDIFSGWIVRRHYAVPPLPPPEARKVLLRNVPEYYNDENNIDKILKKCRGIPLELELAGSQLVKDTEKNMDDFVGQIEEGIEVVDIVYEKLAPAVKEAFLEITSFFYNWESKEVAYIIGEEEFRDLESAKVVKTSEDGRVIVHEIVQGKGKELSEKEGNRITNPKILSEFLEDEEKLKKVKGIFLNEKSEHPTVEINDCHLKCLSNSLRVLYFEGSQIALPMEFEKLERLIYYRGPFTRGISLYRFPPSLRAIEIYGSPQNEVVYSEIPPKVTLASSLVKLSFHGLKNMERLPDGVENLTKLQALYLMDCAQLRKLPPTLDKLCNLKVLRVVKCHELEELPSNIGRLNNLTSLELSDCSKICELPDSFGYLLSLTNLQLSDCVGLKKLSSNFGQLQNLEELNLNRCSGLEQWPSSFKDLKKMKRINLLDCSSALRDSLPPIIKGNCAILNE